MYKYALKVQKYRKLSEHLEAGGVSAAVLSKSGKIYTGVCIDTACGLGVCAERNAIFNMITNGEDELTRVLAIMSNGKSGAPCGACRELIAQLMEDNYQKVEILLDYDKEEIITMKDLTPNWWI